MSCESSVAFCRIQLSIEKSSFDKVPKKTRRGRSCAKKISGIQTQYSEFKRKEVTYSYYADPMYVFMDEEYNQHEIEKDNMGEALNYLEEGMACEVVFYNEKAISVEIPQSLEREIEYTEPAIRGDTSGKVLKPAKLKTGFIVQVPLFCATGDKIEIDTRTGEYRRRV